MLSDCWELGFCFTPGAFGCFLTLQKGRMGFFMLIFKGQEAHSLGFCPYDPVNLLKPTLLKIVQLCWIRFQYVIWIIAAPKGPHLESGALWPMWVGSCVLHSWEPYPPSFFCHTLSTQAFYLFLELYRCDPSSGPCIGSLCLEMFFSRCLYCWSFNQYL